jgi:hypothetical protein
MREGSIASWAVTVIAGAALSLGVPLAAKAADAAKEAATAEQHASYAAAGKDIAAVHQHLQHAVNCLIGPKGPGFNASEANPCKDMGEGAVTDTADATRKKELLEACKKAAGGVKDNDLASAQKTAGEVVAMIKKATMM